MTAEYTVDVTDWHHPDGETLRAEQESELAAPSGREDYEPGASPDSESITVFLVARQTHG